MKRLRRVHPAFTLIEALVCTAIIALLIGLIVPSLGFSRAAARKTVALSNIRGATQIFLTYTNQYSDSLPWHSGDAFVFDRPPQPGATPTFSSGDPFGIRYTWVVTMHSLADWRDHYQTWINPGVLSDRDAPWQRTNSSNGTVETVWPSYFMSNSLAGDPSIWTDEGPVGIARAVRIGDVRFPSEKAMLIDTDRSYLNLASQSSTQRLLGSADGSARSRDDANAKPPALNRITGSSKTYFDSVYGYRGTDY